MSNAICIECAAIHNAAHYKARGLTPERAAKRADANRRYEARNPGRHREYAKSDAGREAIRRATAKKRESPAYRLQAAIRVALHRVLRSGKTGKTFDLLGFTRAELVAHLDRQLLPGMTWQNYGQAWHVDHITPLKAFGADEAMSAWRLGNLRPCWAKENTSKGAKILFLI